MPTSTPLIALISAVPTAVKPIRAALDQQLPGARVWSILDDRLLEEATERGGVTPELERRMRRLITHALTEGADAVILTCSLYAPVARRVAGASTVPILGPDDAVITEAVCGTYRHVLVVSSAPEPLADSIARMNQVARDGVTVSGVVADGAAAAARTGDFETLTRVITDSIAGAATTVDVIVLGQYSLAVAADAVQTATGLPTLAGPAFAVAAMRGQLTGAES